ncbi:Fatty acid hydroxylase domain-containing protein [Pseudomonas marincola]|uniref:Fatty acid hydroxylase domain-containing protein n=1 Tax=Pseudomonas marincola TaxID=437900 RepID=A0A653E0U0_9PSED|nr:sterol desaturase family protein [Pseudomonas marincola]CAE6950398.1 Fatty acid hydroxylase domain-containing protein [Pseudomonas marincola]
MNYILFAVPVFFALIALELLADRWRGVRTYGFSDALNSLSAGVLSTSLGLVTGVVGLLTYSLAWEHLGLFEFDPEQFWVWLFALVFYDFCYYWHHRLGHERNVLWAAHSVHHQSEEYNLTTALRQTSSGFLCGWVFYLPMAIVGVPPLVFLTVAAIDLLYQFWVHTRHIAKLGWFEWVFVSPSNHRVHHAQNRVYMDRNYGGVLIIWDRLFGTFQEELDDEPVVFGVTVPLASWNPLWANLQVYASLWHDARHTASLKDKLRIWFMRTGWRPADVAARFPQSKPDLANFVKFDVPLTTASKAYAVLQLGVALAAGSYLMAVSTSVSLQALLLGCMWIALSLFCLGMWLENRAGFRRLEWLRLASNWPLLWLAGLSGLLALSPSAWLVLGVYTLINAALLWGFQRRSAYAPV